MKCWFSMYSATTRTGSSLVELSAGVPDQALPRVPPLDRPHARQAEALSERRRQREVLPCDVRTVRQHLRQHLLVAEPEIQLRVAREHGMGNAEAPAVQHVAAIGGAV